MTSQELRKKFINFFKNHPKWPHQEIPSASLVPSEQEQLEGTERVLFTSAGMQPLIPYLTGQKVPPSQRLVDVQKCLRTDDIEEVGDEVHHTFFEMLGNWSIGDYWKDEAIRLSFDFLTKELNIPVEKLAVSVFAGDEDAPKDEESASIWKSLGIPQERIFYFGKEHNWWPTARKEQDSGEYKSPFGPCGPDTEMFYWTGEGEPEGKPNEDSRWVEIWNDVFMQFDRKEDGTLEDLPQRNVDTGMGLERTIAVLNNLDDYQTDLFLPIIKKIEEITVKKYDENKKDFRIIADHVKAAVFAIADGVIPSNKERGYVVRRLIRRVLAYFFLLNGKIDNLFHNLYPGIVSVYGKVYPEIGNPVILENLVKEETKYGSVLIKGIVLIGGKMDFDKFFDLYQSHGLNPELILEFMERKGFDVSENTKQMYMDEFKKRFEKHQEISRPTSKGIFKGGLADHSEVVTKYHTATHLLHQALRDVLGPEVFQKGSNITSERLRFDFSYERKLTDEEIQQVEDLVNKKIEEDLKVDRKIVSPTDAKKMNAIGLFDEKYGSEVSIYGIGPNCALDPKAKDQRDRGGYYSLEFCGGPHVEQTKVIGKIKITKEEAISAGIRRIRAEIVLG